MDNDEVGFIKPKNEMKILEICYVIYDKYDHDF